jgi:glycosyltransferase involved in cell wall biosynthesis
MATSIVYLGKRGGGAELSLKLLEDLNSNYLAPIHSVIIAPTNQRKIAYKHLSNKLIEFGGHSKFEKLKAAIKVLIFPTKTMETLGLASGDIVIFPMVSPLDLPINYMCRRKNIKIIRFIHDSQKHPGDFWPGNFTIKWITKNCDVIVTLSKYVESKISDQFRSKVIVAQHPVFDFRRPNFLPNFDLPSTYILFIGRIRNYKGLKLLISAWEKLKGEFDIHLVIAGEGHTGNISREGIVVINRWLDDGEIYELMSGAEIVAFPYIEASQSGLIPSAIASGKKIVITPMPGLIEQLNHYSLAQISESISVNDFVNALKLSLCENTISELPKDKIPKFWLENLWKKLKELEIT